MKLLHVSDWHIGRHTHNHPRRPDHEAVIAEIAGLAVEHHPDLIVHTGDLFDAARPGIGDMAFAFAGLQELSAVAPIVVIAGNHDSPALFELFDQMLGGPRSRLRFIPQVSRPSDGGILDYPTVAGERIRLAPLPFVHANRMIDALEDPARWLGTYQERIHVLEDMLGDGLVDGYRYDSDVLIFAAHLHVGGVAVATGSSERPAFVKAAYETAVDHLPHVSYAAFGHIHRPQALPGANVKGHYAGSPLQLDFGEVGEAKSVVLVEAAPGRTAHITTLPLSAGRRLRRFDGTLDDLRAAAPSIGAELVIATIDTEVPTAGLIETVRDLLPAADVLEVTERCAAQVSQALTRADIPAGTEPGFADLFAEFLSETGTRRSTVKTVIDTFSTLIDAVDAAEDVTFSVVDKLLDTATEAVARNLIATGHDDADGTDDDSPSAGEAAA